jgi:Ca2+-binding EF-hand superfamily protein
MDREAEDSFRRHDRDNDGMLRVDEMSSMLRPMWEKYDTNKDGAIDLNEYKSYFRERQQSRTQDSINIQVQPAQPGQPVPTAPADGLPPAPTMPAQQEEEDRRPVVYRLGKFPKELPAWFVELDTDKDGQVGLYEWVKGGRPVEDFKSIDRNDDGLLTIEEVLGYVRNGNKNPGSDTVVASTGGDRSFRSSMEIRGGPPGSRSMGDGRGGFDPRSRSGDGRGGPPGMRPDFGRGNRSGENSGPPSGDSRSRGDSSGREGGYPSKSRYGRGSDRSGTDAAPTDGSRSDAPKDGKDKKDKKKDRG